MVSLLKTLLNNRLQKTFVDQRFSNNVLWFFCFVLTVARYLSSYTRSLATPTVLADHNGRTVLRRVRSSTSRIRGSEFKYHSGYGYKQGVDKIIETLSNWGTEFVLETLKEFQLAALNVLLFIYTLYCSCQCICGRAKRQSMWKNRKMGELSDF
jgi:hypothetical protein